MAPQWDSFAEDGKEGEETVRKRVGGGRYNLCHSSVVLSHRTMVRVGGGGGGGDVP